MFKRLAVVGLVALGVTPSLASASVDLTTFNDALATGTDALTSMVGTFGTKGILILLAVIVAAVVIFFIKYGFHMGKKAMSGKV